MAAVGAAAAAVFAVVPDTASAHTLDSSKVTIELSSDGMNGEISLAVASLDLVFDPDGRSDVLSDAEYLEQATAYLHEHLTVRGPDGAVWAETYTTAERSSVEGIETLDVDLIVDVNGRDPAAFTITFDAVVEAVPDHTAVLVVVDATNRASTPGVFTSDQTSITIGDGSSTTGFGDMVGHGLRHVFEGADHLLFLLTLLLTAPLVAVQGRWRRGTGLAASLRKVTHVVTAFTIGHSLTLVATSLGWITVPARPVEIVVALSVAVAAVHAIRPLTRRGEPLIAAGFGLAHGMAFAGILADLGLDGRSSLVTLLAFNVGIELAQLAAIACVLPSIALVSSRRRARVVRISIAWVALAAAGGWLVDRLAVSTNPFASIERGLVERPWFVVGAIAVVAVGVRILDAPDTGGEAEPPASVADLVAKDASGEASTGPGRPALSPFGLLVE